MSVLHINQIQKKVYDLFRQDLDLNDVGENDPEKENKILTRALAAYAVYNTVECTSREAAQSVVDGGDDNGIDAIFYSPLNRKMIIVQSKWSKLGDGEPKSDGVNKFCNGVKDLFNLKFDRFNKKIKDKALIIEKALKEYDTRFELIFIDTHVAKDLALHSTRLIDDLLKEMNNTGDDNSEPLIRFSRLNQSKVHSSLALSSGTEPISIEMGLSQWGTIGEPYKAYYGIVSGREVADWWGHYNNRLFERNIRQVLGSTDVNEEIEKTLKDNIELFWYYNNGITIICDKIEKSAVGSGSKEIGFFKLTNIAIVNGAQTVSTIGKFALSNKSTIKIDELKVSVRMIQLSETPENFGKDVTKANNRQNRIENRDFASQDPEQIRIKTELSIDGIEYNIMRYENYSPTDKSFELTEATAALACTSGKTSLAVQAKGGIGKFYENLEKGIYKELFNPSISGYYVFNSVKVVRYIENYLKKKVDILDKTTGREYGLLVHGNRIIALMTISRLKLKKTLDSIGYVINERQLDLQIESVIVTLINYLEIKHTDSFLGSLFKNSTKCNQMVEYLNSTPNRTLFD